MVAHELIYDTADEVMKWIGFGVTPLGTTKAEEEVQGGMKTATGTTERPLGRRPAGRVTLPNYAWTRLCEGDRDNLCVTGDRIAPAPNYA